MKGTCTGCDTVTFIQNKKYGLCGECVYKKNHKGKSKAEVQMEKQQMKWNVISIKIGGVTVEEHHNIDEEAQRNIINQDIAEQKAIEEEGLERFLNRRVIPSVPPEEREKLNIGVNKKNKLKRSKPKQISSKQKEINHFYKLTCIDMDHVTEPVCTGCLKYQGGDVRLSHSHIISREDCKRIGRPELIYARENITYHCMNFGESTGCHGLWENPVRRKELFDYDKNVEYIKSISEDLYLKYTK